MTTFIMFGKYSPMALEGASAARTKRVEQLVDRYDGKLRALYVILGEKDILLIVDLPSIEDAIKVSTNLTRLTGISFTTSPAISAEDFDIFAQLEKP